jgi:hypothetical protein
MCRSDRSYTLLLAIGLLFFSLAGAQDTLPRFSVNKLNEDKVLIQWRNSDTSLRQLSIQQSTDSLKGFQTILTMPDPRLEANGTVINRPAAGKMFYRIYLMYPLGRYRLTTSKLPSPLPPPKPVQILPSTPELPNTPTTKLDRAKPTELPYQELIPKRNPDPGSDSLLTRNAVPKQPVAKREPNKETGEIKKPVTKTEPEKFVPSTRVYTHKDGYPFIQLPTEWDLSQVIIRFFLENGESLFEINRPPLHSFRIDKTNFHRAGWYKFEIWLKGIKIESNRLYLPMEF